ncbi:MAG: hypothetical protein NC231_12800 [Bacillus sp. (in: Bacteria)]|nr:hypothetical protein [Bacillus sp. (in: firmicutes)]MCM1426704.1 hypothetical protein [Eubacterium sp.]
MKRMEKRRSFMGNCCLLIVLTGLVLGGCGKEEADIAASESEPEKNSNAPETIYTAPPVLTLLSAEEEEQDVILRASSYTWTYLESEETATSAVADSAYILDENAPWETIMLPEDGLETESYTVAVDKLPDTLGYTAWDIADVGKSGEEVTPLETYSYSIEEIEASDFALSLQAGRVYEIYMRWDDDKLAENGYCGIAYYPVKTVGTESEENGLTEKANDILLSIDDSYYMEVDKRGAWGTVKSDTDDFSAQFSDILIKYANLDIEKDDYQYTDDGVTYCMKIFDSDGRLVQTLEYLGEYLYIDEVRYREKGTGTIEELYLAIDNLFEEDFPTASFGEIDDGEVDTPDGVTMEASYATSRGIHLVFTNQTDEEYVFGEDYELQAWQDGEWRKVDYIIDNAAFNAIGYSLPPDSTADWGVKWTYFHGVLPNGQYRITKTVNIGAGKELEVYRLAAEFTISGAAYDKELDEANKNMFYKKAKEAGLQEAETENYFQMLCRDDVLQNGRMEVDGLVIHDFDQNGQNDIVIMMQTPERKFALGNFSKKLDKSRSDFLV